MSALLPQDPRDGSSGLYRRIRELLKDRRLRRFRAVVAYVRWQGLAFLSNELEAFLSRGGRVDTIYGVDNGVTTPDALIYAHYLQQLHPAYGFAGVYPWLYTDSIFHPKLFEFDLGRHVVAIIGSANLTGGGLVRNHELGAELQGNRGRSLERRLQQYWSFYRREATPITTPLIRRLQASQRLSSERVPVEAGPPSAEKKPLGIRFPRARSKPLFVRILEAEAPPEIRHRTLANAEALTERPGHLYLQILGETGGGHQIQLPVATLGSFFGVGKGQKRRAKFRFGTDVIEVHLTHFGNNTHRIRLQPLKSVARPAIVVFRRLGTSEYRCSIVPQRRYSRVLASKCREQTRSGSRRWGLDA